MSTTNLNLQISEIMKLSGSRISSCNIYCGSDASASDIVIDILQRQSPGNYFILRSKSNRMDRTQRSACIATLVCTFSGNPDIDSILIAGEYLIIDIGKCRDRSLYWLHPVSDDGILPG